MMILRSLPHAPSSSEEEDGDDDESLDDIDEHGWLRPIATSLDWAKRLGDRMRSLNAVQMTHTIEHYRVLGRTPRYNVSGTRTMVSVFWERSFPRIDEYPWCERAAFRFFVYVLQPLSLKHPVPRAYVSLEWQQTFCKALQPE